MDVVFAFSFPGNFPLLGDSFILELGYIDNICRGNVMNSKWMSDMPLEETRIQ